MLIKSLASSSKGNCYIISDGITTIQLECGIPAKEVRKHIDLLNINALLITHEHKDHIKYLKQFVGYTEVYASAGTLENQDDQFGAFKFRKHILKELEWKKIGTLNVLPFKTEHDAKEPFGYFINSEITNENLLFATDTYYIRNRFIGIDYLMIECNYDNVILKENMDKNLIPKSMERRLVHSHFEISNVIKFIEANDKSRLKEIYLLHLSSGNSNEEDFKRRIEEVAHVPVYVCAE